MSPAEYTQRQPLATERNIALKRALLKLKAADDPDYACVIEAVERLLADAASWPPIHYTRGR